MKRTFLAQLIAMLFPAMALSRSYIDEPSGGGGEDPGKTFSLEYVKELREENKRWRTKAAEAEKKVETAEAAAKTAKETADASVKTAQEKFDADVVAANKTASDRILQSELRASALKAGMVDLDGLKLADLTKVKLKDDGTVEGADALFEDMKKAKPYLFGQTGNSSTPGVPPKPGDVVAKNAKDMTPEEYQVAKAALLAPK